MKKTLAFIIILALAVGLWLFFAEEIEEDLGLENGQEVEMEEEAEDPYEEAEAITPIDERNVVMHEDLSPVLEEVFNQEAKLIDSGDITVLTYVVSREITPDDVMEIRDLLAQKGYKTERSETKDGFYDLNVSITEEVLEEKYGGDFGGSLYIQVWTNERGEENAQMVILKAL